MAKPGALPAIELSGVLPPTYSQGPDPWGVWDNQGGPAIRVGGVIDPSYRVAVGSSC